MFDFDGLTADGKLQALAAVASTVLTIVAAVGAAWWGARSGARSTREAAALSFQNVIESERIERQHVLRESLQALATEFRLNADLVSQAQVMWLSTALQTHALEEARRFVHVLPHETVATIQDASFRVFRFNTIAGAAANFPANAGSIQNQLGVIGRDARPVLIEAARQLEAFLATPRDDNLEVDA